jgi:hypothetical protein
MNRLASVCIVSILVVASILAACSSRAASPDSMPRGKPEVKELQKKRIAVLCEAQKIAHSQYLVGTIEFLGVKAIEREWLEARLDAAETPQQRIAVLEEAQKSAEELLKAADRICAVQATVLDVALAKSLLLKIKIKLLREREAVAAVKD